MKHLTLLAMLLFVGASAFAQSRVEYVTDEEGHTWQSYQGCLYDAFGNVYCQPKGRARKAQAKPVRRQTKRAQIKVAPKKQVKRARGQFKDGQIIPRPSSGTQNDAPGTQYVYSESNQYTIHCMFDTFWKPSSTVRYDADRHRAWVSTGWPHQSTLYQDVQELKGLPPFYDQGITLTAFGDVPLISLRVGFAKNWYERFTDYHIEASWGIIPGTPKQGDRGYCYSQAQPSIDYEPSGNRPGGIRNP